MNLDSKTMCNDVKLSSVCVCVCCAKLGCGGVLKVIILESLMGELLLHLVVGSILECMVLQSNMPSTSKGCHRPG